MLWFMLYDTKTAQYSKYEIYAMSMAHRSEKIPSLGKIEFLLHLSQSKGFCLLTYYYKSGKIYWQLSVFDLKNYTYVKLNSW